ncbi:MAG TPA: hypothetical protein VJ476_01675 [Rhizomicrobium sp.]|nr:hypothetical protein [Rhizomicrobium sp.]
MKAKVLVHVDRDKALEAIRALDALGGALCELDADWPKSLKRKYKEARHGLLHAIGYAALTTGISDHAVID